MISSLCLRGLIRKRKTSPSLSRFFLYRRHRIDAILKVAEHILFFLCSPSRLKSSRIFEESRRLSLRLCSFGKGLFLSCVEFTMFRNKAQEVNLCR